MNLMKVASIALTAAFLALIPFAIGYVGVVHYPSRLWYGIAGISGITVFGATFFALGAVIIDMLREQLQGERERRRWETIRGEWNS